MQPQLSTGAEIVLLAMANLASLTNAVELRRAAPQADARPSLQEHAMTPEEIITDLDARNRDVLYVRDDYQHLTHEQVLSLMNSAAMQGFRLGSNVALSMVKGSILVQLTRTRGPGKKAPEAG